MTVGPPGSGGSGSGSGNGWPGSDPSARPSGTTPPRAGFPGQPVVGAPVRPPSPPRSTTPGSVTVGAAAGRKGGRRARLTVKRIDPWSTLKFSFVYSLAGLVVLLVAVVALYAIVDAMGVIDSIRRFLNDVEGQHGSDSSIVAWLTFGRVFTVALVVGFVNVILFTAFATVSAFIYNVCTDLVGGIEVTLADRA